jgi:twitching motility protein PilT
MEILVPTTAVRNLIREDKIHQIYSQMQTGQDKFGMQTFNQSLSHLVLTNQISKEDASTKSSNPDELQDLINRGIGLNIKTAGQRTTQRPEAAVGAGVRA